MKEQVSEAVVRKYSSKYVFLKTRKLHRKAPELESPFNKVGGLKAFNSQKQSSRGIL